jgi:hypothetical protein
MPLLIISHSSKPNRRCYFGWFGDFLIGLIGPISRAKGPYMYNLPYAYAYALTWDTSPWSWCISSYSHHLDTSLHSHTRHQTVLRLTIQVHMQQKVLQVYLCRKHATDLIHGHCCRGWCILYISRVFLLFSSLYHRIHAHRDRYRITFLAKDARQTWSSGPQCEAFETELLVSALSRRGSKTLLLLEIIPDIIAQSNGLRFLTFGRNIRPYLSAWKMIHRLLSSQSFRNSTAKEFEGIFILSSTRGVTIKRMKDWVFVWISLEFEWSEWVIEVSINC